MNIKQIKMKVTRFTVVTLAVVTIGLAACGPEPPAATLESSLPVRIVNIEPGSDGASIQGAEYIGGDDNADVSGNTDGAEYIDQGPVSPR